MFAAFGPEPELQLYGRGLRRRLPTMVGGDERRMRMLYSLAFSLPGHAGAVLRRGDRHGREPRDPGPLQRARADAVVRRSATAASRRPRTPARCAGRSSPPRAGARSASTSPRSGATPGSLLNWMERLIRRRRECPELGWGRCTLLDAGHAAVLAHRADWDGSTDARAALVRRRAARGAARARAGGRARPSTSSTARTRRRPGRHADASRSTRTAPAGSACAATASASRRSPVGSPLRRLLRRGHARTDRCRWHWASCWRSSLRRPRRRRRRRAIRSRTPSFRGEVPTAQQVIGIDLGDRDVTTDGVRPLPARGRRRQPARDERRGGHLRAGPAAALRDRRAPRARHERRARRRARERREADGPAHERARRRADRRLGPGDPVDRGQRARRRGERHRRVAARALRARRPLRLRRAADPRRTRSS